MYSTCLTEAASRLEHGEGRDRLDTLEAMYVVTVFDSGAGDRDGDEVASWVRDAGFANPRMVLLPI